MLVSNEDYAKMKNEVAAWSKYLWHDAMLYHYSSSKPKYIEPYEVDWDSSRMKEHERYLLTDTLPEIYKTIEARNNISIK